MSVEPTLLTDVDPASGQLTFADGSSATAEVIFACDGGPSATRNALVRRGGCEATVDTLVYEMVHGSERVVVALNRSDVTKTVGGVPTSTYTDLLTGETVAPPLSLQPRSVAVLHED